MMQKSVLEIPYSVIFTYSRHLWSPAYRPLFFSLPWSSSRLSVKSATYEGVLKLVIYGNFAKTILDLLLFTRRLHPRYREKKKKRR